ASGLSRGMTAKRRTLTLFRAMAAAAHMFSYTVSDGKICATWNDREMPIRQIVREGRPVTSFPENQMLPLLGVMCPVIMLTNVVLPAPLAPMMPTVWSAGISTLISRAATTEPNDFSRFRTEMTGVIVQPPALSDAGA